MSKKIVEVVEVVETPVVQKPRVGARAKELLLEGTKTNQEILEILKKEYPEGKTSIACVAWYKSDLKKTKVDEDKPFKDWVKSQEDRLRTEYLEYGQFETQE